MARTIKADGKTIVVPDDATDDEINQLVGPAPKPSQSSTLSTDPSGRTPTGAPALGDQRNWFQRGLDNMTTPDPRKEEWQGGLKTGLDRFAQGSGSAFLPILSHPLDSVVGAAKSIGHAAMNSGGSAQGFANELMRPMIDSTVKDFQENGAGKALPSLLGKIAGGSATGELTGAVAAPAVKGIGKIAENTGLGFGNDALGSVGPKAFKYGQNAARGAYEEGVLPALTKGNAASKIDAVLPEVGKRISGKVLGSINTIPKADIAASINDPLNEALDIMGGPGGGGRSIQPIFDLHDSMGKIAPKANSPIFGSNAPADAAAPDIWRTIQNIDKNTRFNPDPEIEGSNELRRSIRGGLRGNLEDAVPDLKAETQRYADLKQAEESLERTGHKGMNLGHILDAAKFPLQTSVGRVLYSGGRAAQELSPSLRIAFPALSAVTQDKKEKR